MANATAQKNRGKTGMPGEETRFKPGESGNPNGRPKGVLNFKTRLELAVEALAHQFVAQHNKKHPNKQITYDDVDIMGDIFQQYINKARNGDLKAIDSLFDRAYGKAVQPLKHSGDPDNPVEVTQESAKERAARMLAMYGFPVKPAKKPAAEPQAVTTKPDVTPTQKPQRKPQAPAKQPVKKNVPPGRKVSRTPLPSRYAKKK